MRLKLNGPIYDLTDISQRQLVEERHAALLVEHGMRHLDLHEITTDRRVVTQTIAGDLYDEGAAAIRFPSHLDGIRASRYSRDAATWTPTEKSCRSPTRHPKHCSRSPPTGF